VHRIVIRIGYQYHDIPSAGQERFWLHSDKTVTVEHGVPVDESAEIVEPLSLLERAAGEAIGLFDVVSDDSP
jgi:hypothetical protein